jgi:GNAT superfamily N-acetyltransferase
MWPKADGLEHPIVDSLADCIVGDDVVVLIGEIDSVGFGFMIGFVEPLLERVGEVIGAVRYVFTHLEAREVGVGEAMLDQMLDELRTRGIVRFDAHVLPGHRLVKNFFESGGFSARSIVMHHDDLRVR